MSEHVSLEELNFDSVDYWRQATYRLRAENADVRARYSLASARVDALWRTNEQLRAEVAQLRERVADLELLLGGAMEWLLDLREKVGETMPNSTEKRFRKMIDAIVEALR